MTLPVRKSKEGERVHKAREIFWSLALVGVILFATALIASIVLNKNIVEWADLKDIQVSEQFEAVEGLCNQLTYIVENNLDKKKESYLENILIDINRWRQNDEALNKEGMFNLCGLSSDVNLKIEPALFDSFAPKRIFLKNNAAWLHKYIIPEFFLCFGLPSLLCHLTGSVLLLLQYKLVHPWRHLGKKREANLLGKLGGSKRGLDVEMSPWKSGGAVSYERRFSIIAISFRILEGESQRFLLNMKSLVPKREKCNKTASKKPWR